MSRLEKRPGDASRRLRLPARVFRGLSLILAIEDGPFKLQFGA
jgi:hypothetical protein